LSGLVCDNFNGAEIALLSEFLIYFIGDWVLFSDNSVDF